MVGSVVASLSAVAATSPSAPSAGTSSAGFSGSFTIVGGATVATTKSLSVMVGLVSVGNLTDDIFILVPISSPVKSISIFSGIFSATHCNSTLRLTTFKTPPLLTQGNHFVFECYWNF